MTTTAQIQKPRRCYKKAAPFQVGDRVVQLATGKTFKVSWISKGASCRADQIIATEFNDGFNGVSEALCYELAEG